MKISGSVVIVTHNSSNTIAECLSSLAQSDENRNFLTIVVDNCSTDGTDDIIKEHYPWVRLINSPDNGGYGAGNNQGIAVSEGDWIFFLNPDATIRPESLTTLTDQLGLDKSVGIVAPAVIDAKGRKTISHYPFLTFWTSTWNAFGIQRVIPINKSNGNWNFSRTPPNRTIEVDRVIGAAMMAKRRAITESGGFDEMYFLFSEEEDLCYRLAKAGWKIVYHPDAEVRHIGGATMQSSLSISIAAANWSRYLFLKKFRDGTVAELSRWIWVFTLAARLLGALLIPIRYRKTGVIKGYVLSIKSLLSPGYFDRNLRPERTKFIN